MHKVPGPPARKARKARSVFPHPYPKVSYILVEKSGNPKAAADRKEVVAANALAA